jgi:hypothetical protein
LEVPQSRSQLSLWIITHGWILRSTILAGNEADIHEGEDKIVHSEEVTVQHDLGYFVHIETCAEIGMGLNALKACIVTVPSDAPTSFAARSGQFGFSALMNQPRIGAAKTENENRRQICGQNEERIDRAMILRT